MKRTVLLLTAAAVAVTPIAASAATPKPTKRTITYEYSGFSNIGSPAAMFNASAILPICEVADACWDRAAEQVEGGLREALRQAPVSWAKQPR